MVQITPPIHLEMYGPFQQGPFEPTDLSESSPPKLYILCLKYVVKNIIKFNFECRIPSEISDNLIEVRVYLHCTLSLNAFGIFVAGFSTV